MASSPRADYKTIFSYPEMVEDIIIHFAPDPWLAAIDFSTLEPFKSSFVSDLDQPEGRHSDLIWRVRYKDSWLYVYLLFEFQSTINKFMALRMLVCRATQGVGQGTKCDVVVDFKNLSSFPLCGRLIFIKSVTHPHLIWHMLYTPI